MRISSYNELAQRVNNTTTSIFYIRSNAFVVTWPRRGGWTLVAAPFGWGDVVCAHHGRRRELGVYAITVERFLCVFRMMPGFFLASATRWIKYTTVVPMTAVRVFIKAGVGLPRSWVGGATRFVDPVKNDARHYLYCVATGFPICNK